VDLDAVADELYALTPEEFTAARDASARAAQAGGNRKAAEMIRGLRRPTQGAWLVNRLARERADDLGRLLDLGAALREAQAALQGDELRRLSGQRSQVVAALAREAAGLARAAGRTAGQAVLREVEQTLEAALADPAAADEVRAGRLSAALQYAGFGTAALGAAAPKRAARSAMAPVRAKRDPAAELERLQQSAASAGRDLEAAQAAVRAAEDEHRTWQGRVRDAQDALENTRREEAGAALDVREALRRQKTAVKSAQAAERRLTQSRDLRAGDN
jgi:hypothetical protein